MRLPADTPPWRLLQARVPDAGHGLPRGGLVQSLHALAHAHGAVVARAALRTHETPGPGAGDAAGRLYVYLRGTAADPQAIAAALAAIVPALHEVRVDALRPAFDVAGEAAGRAARFHYVVETDPEAGWHDEIVRWYDAEHMPGLARVPGCVRALRALNEGAGPRSLACYDLVDAAVLGSPPWLAVRATPWSERARPHFTHTKRTMFEVLA